MPPPAVAMAKLQRSGRGLAADAQWMVGLRLDPSSEKEPLLSRCFTNMDAGRCPPFVVALHNVLAY